MGIKLMPNGKYKVTVHKRNPITRQPETLRREGLKTRAQAERAQRELLISLGERIHRKVVPLWSKFLDEYLQHMRNNGLKNSTIYNTEKCLKHHTLPAWTEKCLDQVTTEDINKIKNERLAQSSESHKKCVLKYIRAVFKYACERRHIDRNPTPTPKFKINDKIKSVLNEGQIKQLLRKAQEQNWPWYPHYSVALFTGLRSGELYALKWNNVDLERRSILVNCSWSSKDGFKSTKSGDDRRIEIPLPLMPVLRELKLQSQMSEFVLPRISKWDKGEQARQLRLFLKLNGLPEVRFHDLRASWATLLLSKGAVPAKVMCMGGWKDMDTMMIYMRKAGIDILGSTSMLDDLNTHGVETGKLLEIRPS